MISDVGTAMARDGVFAEDQTLKDKLLIKQSDNNMIVPNVLMGAPVKEVDHEFFLISVIARLTRLTTGSRSPASTRFSKTMTSHR
jgi:hypothetical protein